MIDLFPLIAKDRACTALLGRNPVRFTPFGLAGQNPPAPYCVYKIISGKPYNRLGGIPTADHYSVRIAAYARTAGEAERAADAVRAALETDARCTVTGCGRQKYEAKSKLYRAGFNIDFIQNRRVT